MQDHAEERPPSLVFTPEIEIDVCKKTESICDRKSLLTGMYYLCEGNTEKIFTISDMSKDSKMKEIMTRTKGNTLASLTKSGYIINIRDMSNLRLKTGKYKITAAGISFVLI